MLIKILGIINSKTMVDNDNFTKVRNYTCSERNCGYCNTSNQKIKHTDCGFN